MCIVVSIWLVGTAVLLGAERFGGGTLDMEAAKTFAWWPVILMFVCLAILDEVVSGDSSWRE